MHDLNKLAANIRALDSVVLMDDGTLHITPAMWDIIKWKLIWYDAQHLKEDEDVRYQQTNRTNI